ncbi:DUF2634 domain-containing protein [Sneathia sanguinegens]|uniref:DUF2634 domain-containing protein n=1 Tax=Sneathia sanguinegens TaxID=40543 RepID=UPI00258278E3|nr:DUF2634 domain-containing protein [Sneathia sanguinegens]MDU4653001.1 DUF2634 domain-containing protein [Sneathia sanguinegens]
MIPENNTTDIEIVTLSDKTQKLYYKTNDIKGYIDKREAVQQSIVKMLNTERYHYIIYSWDYGLELEDLIGKNMSYVIPEIKRRIIEAIEQDDRVERIYDFKFEKINKESILVTFIVDTIFGKLEIAKEVSL